MIDDIVDAIKKCVDKGEVENVKIYLLEVSKLDLSSPFDYIFQKVYLHTCLLIGINKLKGEIELMRKQEEIHTFLLEVCYPMIPEVQKIAIRQVFPYGNWLRKK